MKLFLIKLAVLLLCIPAYPFMTIGAYYERNSYLGKHTPFKKVSREYWKDVKEALLYKEGGR